MSIATPVHLVFSAQGKALLWAGCPATDHGSHPGTTLPEDSYKYSVVHLRISTNKTESLPYLGCRTQDLGSRARHLCDLEVLPGADLRGVKFPVDT